MEDDMIKVGDKVVLIDEETGDVYKEGVVEVVNVHRGRYGVRTETGSFAVWKFCNVKKL